MSSWDYLSKFVIVGDSGVGKSSLLVRLTDDRFLADSDPTVGVEFGSHLMRMEGEDMVKVQVWDTAGSEAFRSITRSYYRGAAGALLVYSVAHRPSFLHISSWLQDVRANAEESVSIVLVGNMLDLCNGDDEGAEEGEGGEGEAGEEEEGDRSREELDLDRRRRRGRREVETKEAREFAEREGLMFVETSAKTGHNVVEAFHRAASDVHAKFLAEGGASGVSGAGPGGGGGGGSIGRRGGKTITTAGGSAGGGAGLGSGAGGLLFKSGRGGRVSAHARGASEGNVSLNDAQGTGRGCCTVM